MARRSPCPSKRKERCFEFYELLSFEADQDARKASTDNDEENTGQSLIARCVFFQRLFTEFEKAAHLTFKLDGVTCELQVSKCPSKCPERRFEFYELLSFEADEDARKASTDNDEEKSGQPTRCRVSAMLVC